jgi:hypothetical protein
VAGTSTGEAVAGRLFSGHRHLASRTALLGLEKSAPALCRSVQGSQTLKAFGLNPKHLGADIGMTAILHTHSRRLTYHPHLHVVVPGGGVDVKRGVWKRTRYRYLFNKFALAKVFRGKLLHEIDKLDLRSSTSVPKEWVVDCRHAGRGESALEYLSRYLYRGVIGESSIIADHNGQVTFRYIDGETMKSVPKPCQVKIFSGGSFSMPCHAVFTGSGTMAFCIIMHARRCN